MTFVAPPEIIKALAITVANVTERYQRFRLSNYAVQTFKPEFNRLYAVIHKTQKS